MAQVERALDRVEEVAAERSLRAHQAVDQQEGPRRLREERMFQEAFHEANRLLPAPQSLRRSCRPLT